MVISSDEVFRITFGGLMILLITFVLIALIFSFLCSIAEAVILSVSPAYVALLEKQGISSASILRSLKQDIHRPLAAILTLNTIAHTIGAAGAGAQAQAIFGSNTVAVTSVVLTLLILIFSEIIPKTIGAEYWRILAPTTAYALRVLIFLLYPFVKIAEKLTFSTRTEPRLNGFSREEFAVMAEVSADEGQILHQESRLLKNLLLLSGTNVSRVLTPRSVVFSRPENSTVAEYFYQYDHIRFSRIPLFGGSESENITGFVLRNDLLLAQARGNSDIQLSNYARNIDVIPKSTSVARALETFIESNSHIMMVVDEYGGVEGILTLEDLLETLLGDEIVDEGDQAVDMQQLARRLGKKRLT